MCPPRKPFHILEHYVNYKNNGYNKPKRCGVIYIRAQCFKLYLITSFLILYFVGIKVYLLFHLKEMEVNDEVNNFSCY